MTGEQKSLISDLPETGVIFTIIGVGCYLIGYYFVAGYFERFGLPQSILNLQFTSYLTLGSYAILISLGVTFFFLFFNEIPSENKILCFFANIPLLIVSLLFFINSTWILSLNFIFGIIIILCGVGTLIAYFLTIRAGVFIFKFYSETPLKETPFKKITSLFLYFMILILLSQSLGYYYGTITIEADPHSTTFIQIYMFNNSLNLNGKDMAYITHQNNKYFITQPEKPAPQYPLIYIIEDSQVEIATFKPSNNLTAK